MLTRHPGLLRAEQPVVSQGEEEQRPWGGGRLRVARLPRKRKGTARARVLSLGRKHWPP